MTDQTPADLADKVRKIVNDMRSHADHDAVRGREEEYVRHFADRLDALLPAPATLADMTEEERAACQWMQADIIGGDEPLVIAHIERSDGTAVILDRNGRYDEVPAGAVTPRPDLPRMEWPGTEKPEDVTPVKVGDVIESAADPRIAALPVGSILSDCDGDNVAKRHGEWVGNGYIPIPREGKEFGPWKVMRIGWEDDQ